MKLFKAPVLFVFFAVLVSFTAMASLGNPLSAGGNTISSAAPAPQAKDNEWQHREVKAAEKSAHQDLYANWIGGIALILTFAMLVAAGIAAWYAKKSADAAKQSLEDNEKYNRIQNRAYIGLDCINFKNLHAGGLAKFEIKVKNFGNTPAYNVSILHGIDHFEKNLNDLSLEDNFKKLDTTFSGCIWPNQILTIPLFFSDRVPQSVIDGLNSSDHLFIYGKIYYFDKFNDKHENTFCAYTDKMLLGSKDGFLSFYKKYNTAD